MRPMEFRVNNFDLLRLLAALQVLLVHGLQHFRIADGGPLLAAFPGVPIFFVISGFLISASWENSKSLSVYLKNRCLRIYPALWVCLAVSLVTVFLLSTPKFRAGEFALWLAAQLTIGQFYNPDFLRAYGVGVLNGSLWTIPVELQFYAVLPLVYWCFAKVRWQWQVVAATVVLLMLAPIALHVGLLSHPLLSKLSHVTLLPYLYVFMLGVVLQRNLWFVERFLRGKALVWAAVYVAVTLAAYGLGVPHGGNDLNPVSAAFLAVLVVSLAYTGEHKWSTVLGGRDVSYGVYIYHMVWTNALLAFGIVRGWPALFVMLAVTVGSALVSWHLVEKPALALKRRTLRAQPKADPVRFASPAIHR